MPPRANKNSKVVKRKKPVNRKKAKKGSLERRLVGTPGGRILAEGNSKAQHKKLKADGGRIYSTRQYGMFSDGGNDYVDSIVSKYRKSKEFDGGDWRQIADAKFRKAWEAIILDTAASAEFPEVQDSAVSESIWLALVP